jgi:1-acyl-sn-glycerol-3-phosphate acyltransferase
MGGVITQGPTTPLGAVSPRPGLLFRAAMLACRFLAQVVFGLRMELLDAGNLPRDAAGRPAGGWIAAPAPHRRWIDPFLMLLVLPIQPRIVFFADGRVLYRTPFRRWLFRALGGVVPVWKRGGPRAFFSHIESARQVVDGGAVFVIFPEAGPPSAPDAARPIEPGFGYMAMRTRAPLVPLVIAGTGELYRGRRLTVRVMPATNAAELAGLPDGAALPEAGSHEERAAARRIAETFQGRMAPLIAADHRALERRTAGDRRRWTWLTNWLDWDADAAERTARGRGSTSAAEAPEGDRVV